MNNVTAKPIEPPKPVSAAPGDIYRHKSGKHYLVAGHEASGFFLVSLADGDFYHRVPDKSADEIIRMSPPGFLTRVGPCNITIEKQ